MCLPFAIHSKLKVCNLHTEFPPQGGAHPIVNPSCQRVIHDAESVADTRRDNDLAGNPGFQEAVCIGQPVVAERIVFGYDDISGGKVLKIPAIPGHCVVIGHASVVSVVIQVNVFHRLLKGAAS